MPVIKIQTKLVGDFLGKPKLFFNGIEIGLSYNGVNEYQSTDPLNILDEKLRIYFHGQGIPTAKWTLTIKQLEPKAKDLDEQKGTIDENGHAILAHSIKIPDKK